MATAPKWRNEDGIPVLEGNAATIECKPWRLYDGGDHVIVIGEVTDIEVSDKNPLLFHSGKFRELGPYSGGSPWNLSADSLDCGWFEGTTYFESF